jgi:hypothetical protein
VLDADSYLAWFTKANMDGYITTVVAVIFELENIFFNGFSLGSEGDRSFCQPSPADQKLCLSFDDSEVFLGTYIAYIDR